MPDADTTSDTEKQTLKGSGQQYERPSQRMFRRSRAAEMRRRQAARKEDRFMRFVFGVAGFALLLAFLFFFMFAQTVQAAESTADETGKNASLEWLNTVILGNFTVLDVGGVAFVLVSGYAVFRRYFYTGKDKG